MSFNLKKKQSLEKLEVEGNRLAAELADIDAEMVDLESEMAQAPADEIVKIRERYSDIVGRLYAARSRRDLVNDLLVAAKTSASERQERRRQKAAFDADLEAFEQLHARLIEKEQAGIDLRNEGFKATVRGQLLSKTASLVGQDLNFINGQLEVLFTRLASSDLLTASKRQELALKLNNYIDLHRQLDEETSSRLTREVESELNGKK